MPIQAPQWTEFLTCPVCTREFNEDARPPVSLGCGHTICRQCLSKLSKQQCPYDQTEVKTAIEILPVNYAILQLGVQPCECPKTLECEVEEIRNNQESFDYARTAIEDLARYLRSLTSPSNSSGKNGMTPNGAVCNALTRPMQRKLVTLVNCQLVEEEGRCRALRAARSLGERAVKELILLHQNPQHLSANLWASVRNRGCQFLGPAMQDEVLKLITLALEDGTALSRKVLVLFVVQRLESKFAQASKTSIGHVVQLLYRASCFKVTKREGDSSLLQLHEKFRAETALRKEHDTQIVHIAMEAGLHISPEQWSALLYGDDEHKSHMQSIIDKLQTPASFSSSIQELIMALQKTNDPADLQRLRFDLEHLANIDPSSEGPAPTWEELKNGMAALKAVIDGLVDFFQNHSSKLKGSMESQQTPNSKYKTSMCRDIQQRNSCPRGAQCSFAHSTEELERHRKKRSISRQIVQIGLNRTGSSTSPETVSSPVRLENGMNSSRESPDEIVRNGSTHSGSDIMQNPCYIPNGTSHINGTSSLMNGSHLTNGSHIQSASQLAGGSHMSNGTHIPNGAPVVNGAGPMLNGHPMVPGTPLTNGTHLHNGASIGSGHPHANGGPMKNGAHMVSPAGMPSGLQRISYQRHGMIQTDGPMGPAPVTYFQPPVNPLQRSLYVSNSDVYQYSPNQHPYIQHGVPVYANEPLLQLSRPYHQFVQPQYTAFGLAAGRGLKDKDKEENDLSSGCVGRGIFSESIDDLKLDTGRSSSSLFTGKSESIWGDSHDKPRGSSLTSGLDGSLEYSSETFSPLSTDSCGSPQSIQMYGNSWNQFETQRSGLNDSREFSPQSSIRKQNGFPNSQVWFDSEDSNSLSLYSQGRKHASGSADWDTGRHSMYKRLISQDDDDKGLLFNHSGDTQSSFEEASSEDLCPARYDWPKRFGPPPGIPQPPIGTKSSASGSRHSRWDFSRPSKGSSPWP